MKNKLTRTINLLSICCALIFATACQTPTGEPTGPVIKWTPANTDELLRDLQLVAADGVPILLEDEPQIRPKIQKAVDSLSVLATDDDITLDDIVDILKVAGLDQIKSPKGRLAVLGGKLFLNRIVYSVDFSASPNYAKVVLALRDGLQAGLDNSPVSQ